MTRARAATANPARATLRRPVVVSSPLPSSAPTVMPTLKAVDEPAAARSVEPGATCSTRVPRAAAKAARAAGRERDRRDGDDGLGSAQVLGEQGCGLECDREEAREPGVPVDEQSGQGDARDPGQTADEQHGADLAARGARSPAAGRARRR